MNDEKQLIVEREHHRPDELARMLDVSEETVRRWARLKKIRCIHVSGLLRIPHDEFERIRKEGVVRCSAL